MWVGSRFGSRGCRLWRECQVALPTRAGSSSGCWSRSAVYHGAWFAGAIRAARWDSRSATTRLQSIDSSAPPRLSVKTLSLGNSSGLSTGVRVMALIELKFTRSAWGFGVVRDLDERAVVSVAFGCSAGLAGELAVSRRIRGPLTDRLGLRSKIKGRLILAQIQTRPSLGSQPSVHLIKAKFVGEQKKSEARIGELRIGTEGPPSRPSGVEFFSRFSGCGDGSGRDRGALRRGGPRSSRHRAPG